MQIKITEDEIIEKKDTADIKFDTFHYDDFV